MKSIQFIFTVSILLTLSPAFAQYKYSVSLGGSHEKLNNAYGNHARLYYNFTDNFKLNTEFVRYFEVEEKSELEAVGYDIRELNLNLNYAILFGDKQKFGLYAVLGFTYTYGRKASKNDSIVNEKFLESGGMNFGFGTFYKMGHFMPYGEMRNVSSGSSNYLIFSVGLAYSFGKLND